MSVQASRRPAVVYTRLSVMDSASSSLAGQDTELTARAVAEQWQIVKAFADEGVSGGKQRANADAALAMLADGRADVLAVYAYDRWSRQGVEFLADLLRVLRQRRESGNPARFVAIREGVDGDGSEDGFDLRLSISADLARAERDRTAARMRAAVAYRHTVGRHTGGPAPFGYRTADAPDGGKVLVVDETEAALVRRMADRLLKGVGVSTLARELRDQGIATAKSDARIAALKGQSVEGLDRGIWDATTVRRLLTSDRIAGRVTHKGRLVTDEDGLPITHFEPVLDADTVERIRARLAPATRPTPARRAERLLSGVAFCGTCGGRLWAGTVRNGIPVYRCPGRGCGQPASIRAEALESHVAEAYLSIAGAWPELEEVESVDGSPTSALADIERAIDQVLADMRERGADRVALAAKLDELDARADTLRSVPATVTVSLSPTGRTLGEAWQAAEDDGERRRSLLRALDHVAVAASQTRGRRINLDRVALNWRAPRFDAI